MSRELDNLNALYRFAKDGGQPRNVLEYENEATVTLGNGVKALREAELKVAVYERVLAFYADADNHKPVEVPTSVSEDGGLKARAALMQFQGV